MKATTQAETRKAVLEALNLAAPCSFTPGELLTVLQNSGWDIRKAAVKRTLETALKKGEVQAELKTVKRNGFTVENTPHYYATRRVP